VLDAMDWRSSCSGQSPACHPPPPARDAVPARGFVSGPAVATYRESPASLGCSYPSWSESCRSARTARCRRWSLSVPGRGRVCGEGAHKVVGEARGRPGITAGGASRGRSQSTWSRARSAVAAAAARHDCAPPDDRRHLAPPGPASGGAHPGTRPAGRLADL